MPVKGVELEITEGITEHSSRVALKGVFQNFGDVVACWVPPIDRRAVDKASVRFGNAASAEAAKVACDSGQVFLQGLPVKVDYRTGGGRRVGNSDLGESAANNDDGKARAIMDANSGPGARGRRSRSRRRRSRSRSRNVQRRSRSREKRRSRSRERLRRDRSRSRERHGEVPALPPPTPAVQPEWAPPAGTPPPGAFSGVAPPNILGAAGGLYGGMATPLPAALPEFVPPAVPAVDPVAEAKKKAEIAAARAERAKQLKRGPGVAALVQGALKRALTQPSVNKKPEEAGDKVEKPKEIGKPSVQAAQQVEDETDEESEETLRKKQEEQAKTEAKKRKERQEREAREREKAEREARERREQAKREAAEAEQALQQKEAETREQRIKASVEAAKRQQAERAAAKAAKEAAATTDNLYANMPQPNLEDLGLNEARKEAAVQREKANKDLSNLPPEDRSKVLFLDVDGVLRPARAGGFDILSVDGDAAKHVDTSDFFPSAVKALRHIIERTAAKIVLSSEWRRSEALCAALSDLFEKNRVRAWSSVTTFKLELEASPDPVRSFAERRAREITMWLQEHERDVSGWVVLDDINLAIADEARKQTTKTMQPHLVQTWPLCGLTMGNAKTAVRILNGEMINKVVVERPVAPVGSGGAAAGVVVAAKK